MLTAEDLAAVRTVVREELFKHSKASIQVIEQKLTRRIKKETASLYKAIEADLAAIKSNSSRC